MNIGHRVRRELRRRMRRPYGLKLEGATRMTLTFSAVVEKDGRLRPINCVPLPEGTEVAVTVEVEQKPPPAARARRGAS